MNWLYLASTDVLEMRVQRVQGYVVGFRRRLGLALTFAILDWWSSVDLDSSRSRCALVGVGGMFSLDSTRHTGEPYDVIGVS